MIGPCLCGDPYCPRCFDVGPCEVAGCDSGEHGPQAECGHYACEGCTRESPHVTLCAGCFDGEETAALRANLQP